MKKKNINFTIFLLSILFFTILDLSANQKMILNVPIANLRSDTIDVDSTLKTPALAKDIGPQNSQVLLGEHLLTEEIKENPEWLKTIALEQEIFNWELNGWTGCPRYIKKNQAIKIEDFPIYNLVTTSLCSIVYLTDKSDTDSTILSSLGTKLSGEKINDNA